MVTMEEKIADAMHAIIETADRQDIDLDKILFAIKEHARFVLEDALINGDD